MKNTESAFYWIVGVLKNHKIPFQVSGGLAARLYGSVRKLADIDIDIPEDRFLDILSEVKDRVKFGPRRYQDENWDLLLLTLTYEGQDIDLSGAYETKVFDKKKTQWVSIKDDFSTATLMNAYGLEVPVMNREELIRYKRTLARDVDEIDIIQMTSDKK